MNSDWELAAPVFFLALNFQCLPLVCEYIKYSRNTERDYANTNSHEKGLHLAPTLCGSHLMLQLDPVLRVILVL